MKNRALEACPEDHLRSFGETEFMPDEEIPLAEQYCIPIQSVNLSMIYELKVICIKT